MSEGTSEEKSATGLWSQLPSFDPSSDDIREFHRKHVSCMECSQSKTKGTSLHDLPCFAKGQPGPKYASLTHKS